MDSLLLSRAEAGKVLTKLLSSNGYPRCNMNTDKRHVARIVVIENENIAEKQPLLRAVTKERLVKADWET
jgi:hypothetical protein